MIIKKGKGESEKAPVLFIHGAWHGAWCWEKYFMKHFSQNGYDCYALNLRKHGTPGNVKGINCVSIKDYVEDVKSAVDKIGRLPILVGHSMGGMILQKYLEKYECEKAVLMTSAPPRGSWISSLKLLTKGYIHKSMLTLNSLGIVDTPEKAKWAFFSERIDKTELEEYSAKMSRESIRAMLYMMFPSRIKINFHKKVPMLVIGAENDKVVSISDNKNTAKKYRAELKILPDIAHDMMLDVNHKSAAEAIIKWIEQ